MIVYLATGNPGKVADFRALGLPAELLPGIASLPSIEETGTTFEANARLKGAHYSRFCEDMVVADDSGLEVDALDGAPGVFSARFAGRHGDDAANNRLLLERMTAVPVGQRGARFRCVLAVARQGLVLATFTGTALGEILAAPRGAHGFGYDPLFYSPVARAAFGELTGEHKGRISHRGQAVRALLEWVDARQG